MKDILVPVEVTMLIRFAVFAVIMMSLVLGGCGPTKDYALVQKNLEVDRAFRAGTVIPEYRYFYYGPEVEPVAVLALKRDYTLQAKFWQEIDLTDARLRDWIKEFDRITGEYDDIEFVMIDYEGREILSKDNRRIGMVYSRYGWVIAWFGEDKIITVAPPKPLGSQRAHNMWRLKF